MHLLVYCLPSSLVSFLRQGMFFFPETKIVPTCSMCSIIRGRVKRHTEMLMSKAVLFSKFHTRDIEHACTSLLSGAFHTWPFLCIARNAFPCFVMFWLPSSLTNRGSKRNLGLRGAKRPECFVPSVPVSSSISNSTTLPCGSSCGVWNNGVWAPPGKPLVLFYLLPSIHPQILSGLYEHHFLKSLSLELVHFLAVHWSPVSCLSLSLWNQFPGLNILVCNTCSSFCFFEWTYTDPSTYFQF